MNRVPGTLGVLPFRTDQKRDDHARLGPSVVPCVTRPVLHERVTGAKVDDLTFVQFEIHVT